MPLEPGVFYVMDRGYLHLERLFHLHQRGAFYVTRGKRRVRYYDVATRTRFTFLTNNFLLPVLLVAQLYQCRWTIEVFFK